MFENPLSQFFNDIANNVNHIVPVTCFNKSKWS